MDMGPAGHDHAVVERGDRAISMRIRDFLRANALGLVAIFIALSGTAYATHPDGADTISSGDIIDGEVKTADVRDNTLAARDLRPESVGDSEVVNGSLTGDDIADAAITMPKLAALSVDSSKVVDDSLTGADIDESTLSGLPSGPPSGLAGGALKGTYPNPALGLNAVVADARAPGDGSSTVANGAIDSSEIAVDAVGGIHVGDESLTGDDIENGSLNGGEIANGPTLHGNQLIDETLTGADILNGSLNGGEISVDTLGRREVFEGALTGVEIENGTIAAADLGAGASPADGTGTNGSTKLATTSVGFDEIALSAVRSSQILNESLTSSDILANTLTGADIAESTLSGAGHVRSAEGPVPPSVTTLDATNKVMVSEPIPETANYLLLGRVFIEANGGDGGRATCKMNGDGESFPLPAQLSGFDIQEVSLMSVRAGIQGNSFQITCTKNDGGNLVAYAARLMVIPIATFS